MRKILLLIILAILISCNNKNLESDYSTLLDSSYIWTYSMNINEQSYVGFRKEFDIDELPKKAEIRIFADNRYVLWINSQFIDMGPSRFDPKHPQYDLFNITGNLQKGKNTISILVHNYAISKQELKSCRIVDHQPGVTALLTLNTRNNELTHIMTDTTWKYSARTEYLPSPGSYASIEDNINRNLISDWQNNEYDDSDWDYALRVSPENWGTCSIRSIPYMSRDTIYPNKIIEWKKNNMTKRQGWLLKEEFPLTLEEGDEIIIDIEQYVQAITEIDLYTADSGILEIDHAGRYYQNDRIPETVPTFAINSSNGPTIYIAKKGKQKYRSNDSHGYKYMVLSCKKGDIAIEGLKVINRLYPFEKVGEFKSNDTILNKIWDISVNTIRFSSEDAYVSSIGYERGQWIGDAIKVSYPITNLVFVTKENEKLTFHDNRLLKNALRHTAYTQLSNGRVIAECPPSSTYDASWRQKDKESGLIFSYDDYACIWIEGIAEIGKHYNDLNFVQEMWPYMKKQIDLYLNHKSYSGFIKASEFFFYGNPLAFKICEGASINAFLYGAIRNMEKMAKDLKENDQVLFYNVMADSLYQAFNTELWIDSLKMYSGGILNDSKYQPTVHTAIAALTFNLVPEERIQFVVNYIKTNFESANLWPYTYLYLFDLIYKYPLLFNDMDPIALINEKWHLMLNYETGLTSEGFPDYPLYYDHRAGAVPAYVLSKYVFGVKEGLKKTEIKPQLFHLSKVKGTVCTKHGPVSLEFDRTGDLSMTFKIQLPINPQNDYVLIFKLEREGFTLDINDKKYTDYLIKNNEIHIVLCSENTNGRINFYSQRGKKHCANSTKFERHNI